MDEFIEEVGRCPVTGGELRALGAAEIDRLDARRADGMLRRRDGTLVQDEIRAGYVSIDGTVAYPVANGVITLLADRAVVLDAGEEPPIAQTLRSEKESVRAFYDEVGWQKTDDDVYEDTARFVDTRPEVEEYNRRSMERVSHYLPLRGKYFLDVASGPVQFPEYVAYSDGFERRICVDFSALALAAAKDKLGERGIYVLGDITNLPLKDDSIDGVISLHTIYHVPAEEQATAFRELHRVLKPDSSAVIAYTWGRTPWGDLSPGRRLLLLPSRVFQRLVRALSTAADGREHVEEGLYFHAYDHRWFVTQDWPFRYEIYVGHVLTAEFMKRYIRPRLLGRQILRLVAGLEERFPRLAARVGRYPLIVIRKERSPTGPSSGR